MGLESWKVRSTARAGGTMAKEPKKVTADYLFDNRDRESWKGSMVSLSHTSSQNIRKPNLHENEGWKRYQGQIPYKVIIINQKKEPNNIPRSNKTLKDTHLQYSHKIGGKRTMSKAAWKYYKITRNIKDTAVRFKKLFSVLTGQKKIWNKNKSFFQKYPTSLETKRTAIPSLCTRL